SAVELSKRILADAQNNLQELSRKSVKDLTLFKGVGEAKAISIVAALELGRRRKEATGIIRSKISTSKDAVEIFQPLLGDLLHEEFWILFMNRANHILGRQQVSKGGMSGTVVDPKLIFKAALDMKASSIILCHNHPSGNLKPSESDIKLTKSLSEAGRVLEIPVLDHVIVTQNGFISFADEGMM